MAITADDYVVEDRGYETPCWIVKTKKSNGRYALIRIDGREVFMHRAMYEQEVGPIPAGRILDHLCRQTKCIRPSHLEPVTVAVNTRRGKSAKLDQAKVDLIRSSERGAVELAEELGVSWSLVYMVRRGDVWHV